MTSNGRFPIGRVGKPASHECCFDKMVKYTIQNSVDLKKVNILTLVLMATPKLQRRAFYLFITHKLLFRLC